MEDANPMIGCPDAAAAVDAAAAAPAVVLFQVTQICLTPPTTTNWFADADDGGRHNAVFGTRPSATTVSMFGKRQSIVLARRHRAGNDLRTIPTVPQVSK
jgi:hypothetical protein